MPQPLPHLCVIAVPGRRRRTIELAKEVERRGFAGIFSPSPFGNMSLCEALCWNTDRIPFGTAIAPIYQRTVTDFAQSAAAMHEFSGGRFRLGIGVAHGPSHVRMGVTPGKPLSDIRTFVERFRGQQDRCRGIDHCRFGLTAHGLQLALVGQQLKLLLGRRLGAGGILRALQRLRGGTVVAGAGDGRANHIDPGVILDVPQTELMCQSGGPA